jgi:hypothetical protein
MATTPSDQADKEDVKRCSFFNTKAIKDYTFFNSKLIDDSYATGDIYSKEIVPAAQAEWDISNIST